MKPILSNLLTHIKTRTKKVKIAYCAILVLVGIGIYMTMPKASAAPTYQTATVSKDTIIVSVTASGQVAASNALSITTQASGVVKKVYVKNGDPVTAGQTIAELEADRDSLQRQSQAYASYLNAVNSAQNALTSKVSNQADLESKRNAVINAGNAYDTMIYNRNNGINNPATKQPYTQNEIDMITSSLTSARQTFTASEQKFNNSDTSIGAGSASQTSAWYNYQLTLPVITAPIAGTVDALTLQLGAIITNTTSSTSNSNSSSSQKVGVVKTSGNPTVTVSVSQIDAPNVKPGQKATITFDAFPDKTFTGKVIALDTTGTVTSGVTTYAATIVLDTASTDIFTNMTASATIITNVKTDVIAIPSTAITTSNGVSTVRVMQKGQPQSVTVETGVANDTNTEITSGLSEGDTIVTSVIRSTKTSTTGSTTASPFSRNTGFGGAIGGSGGAARGATGR